MTKPLPVLVIWIDSAYHEAGWELIDEARALTPKRCISVGFLIRKTKKRLVLALSITEGQAGGLLVIPRCAVLSVKRFQ